MSRITLDIAENFAIKMRSTLQFSLTEPINVKTVLRLLGVITSYKPLSDSLYGLSLKSSDDRYRFMLVNSNSTRGRQHFTVAHELYHLFFDENPQPHFCKEEQIDESERAANMFARAFLMPQAGVMKAIPDDELASGKVSLTTVLNLESLFGVSHMAMLIRLKELKLISNPLFEKYQAIRVTYEATLRGLNTDLYQKGNEGLIIGDFGARARELFEKEIISEGHYVELLNKIGYGIEESGNSAGC
ncbi:MAG: ImmA/IrrE family metallo-endopeptidase [Bacteroidales bacterium]|nr:ImmA/IrrE family metallo-endopeptidase [Bacteroidales bacterium]